MFSKPVVVAVSLTGITSVSFVGFYFKNSKNIWNVVSDKCVFSYVKEEEESVWSHLQEKLAKVNETDLELPEFKKLNKQLKINDSQEKSDKTGKHIKNLCLNIYNQKYSNMFYEAQKYENKLKNTAETYCSVKIQEMLDESKRFKKETSKDKLDKKIEELKKDIQENSIFWFFDELNKVNNKEKELISFCESKYNNYYQGNYDSLNIIKKYCSEN